MVNEYTSTLQKETHLHPQRELPERMSQTSSILLHGALNILQTAGAMSVQNEAAKESAIASQSKTAAEYQKRVDTELGANKLFNFLTAPVQTLQLNEKIKATPSAITATNAANLQTALQTEAKSELHWWRSHAVDFPQYLKESERVLGTLQQHGAMDEMFKLQSDFIIKESEFYISGKSKLERVTGYAYRDATNTITNSFLAQNYFTPESLESLYAVLTKNAPVGSKYVVDSMKTALSYAPDDKVVEDYYKKHPGTFNVTEKEGIAKKRADRFSTSQRAADNKLTRVEKKIYDSLAHGQLVDSSLPMTQESAELARIAEIENTPELNKAQLEALKDKYPSYAPFFTDAQNALASDFANDYLAATNTRTPSTPAPPVMSVQDISTTDMDQLADSLDVRMEHFVNTRDNIYAGDPAISSPLSAKSDKDFRNAYSKGTSQEKVRLASTIMDSIEKNQPNVPIDAPTVVSDVLGDKNLNPLLYVRGISPDMENSIEKYLEASAVNPTDLKNAENKLNNSFDKFLQGENTTNIDPRTREGLIKRAVANTYAQISKDTTIKKSDVLPKNYDFVYPVKAKSGWSGFSKKAYLTTSKKANDQLIETIKNTFIPNPFDAQGESMEVSKALGKYNGEIISISPNEFAFLVAKDLNDYIGKRQMYLMDKRGNPVVITTRDK